jgi:hypothetical protein
MSTLRLPFFLSGLMLICFLFTSCNKNDKNASHAEIEKILSGEWKIVSYLMPKYGTGSYYMGQWVYQDTLLKDVGSLFIPSFSAFDLDLYEQILIPLHWTLTVDNEEFFHTIEYLIPRENGVFLALRSNFSNTGSEAGKFVHSSRIFNKNVEVLFESETRLVITNATPDDNYKVILEKK